jgi:hypothetical protein
MVQVGTVCIAAGACSTVWHTVQVGCCQAVHSALCTYVERVVDMVWVRKLFLMVYAHGAKPPAIVSVTLTAK